MQNMVESRKSFTVTDEEIGRMNLYIPKSIIKKLKHIAVDKEIDLSELASEAFISFLETQEKKE